MSAANNSQKSKVIGLCIAFVVLLVIVIAWYASDQSMTPAMTPANTSVQMATTTSHSTVAPATSTSTSTASSYPPPSLGESNGILTINAQKLYVDLAVNPAQQELGLGNRASLGAEQGMLFIFPNDDIHMFWMKDMSFSIDMIWLSDDGTIMYIQPNVSPATYPEAFGPNAVSRYVLEVSANYAAEHGIAVGDKVLLP